MQKQQEPFTNADIKSFTLQHLITYIKTIQIQQSRQKDIEKTRQLIISLKDYTLDHLRQQFKKHTNMVNLQKFLYLMKQSIQFNQNKKYQVYYQIVRLFQQIDIDSSQYIDWPQLLQFLSCNGWVTSSGSRQSQDQFQTIINNRDKTYLISHKQFLKFRKNPIKKIIQIQKLGLLGLVEKKSNQLHFITLEGNSSDYKLTAIANVSILSIDYSQSQRLFGILTLERKILFIQQGQIQKKIGSVPSMGNQSQIKWLQIHKLWVLVGIDNTLQAFSSPKGVPVAKITFKPHKQPLTGLCQIKNPLALVTSSLDGKIKIWSLSYKQLLIELNPGNQQDLLKLKGIRGIATFNCGITSFMASWTFSSQISLWCPSSSLSKPYLGLLKGQAGIIEDCCFCFQKAFLVSSDNKRTIRVWDVQNMSCLQIWSIDQQINRLFCLKFKSYLLIYNKLISFYKMQNGTKAQMLEITSKNPTGQQQKVICIEFCSYYDYLLILSNQQLRVIEINSAIIVLNIRPSQSQQFICMTLKTNRRVYIASNQGFIYFYKIDDGMLIRKFQALPKSPIPNMKPNTNSQIKFMYFHQKTDILIVGVQKLSSSILYTYNQSLQSDNQIVKEAQFSQNQIQFFCFSIQLELFCIASNNGLVTIWDYQKFAILNKIDVGLDIIKIKFQEKKGFLFILTTQQIQLYRMDSTCSIKDKIILKSENSPQSQTKIKYFIGYHSFQIINSKLKSLQKIYIQDKIIAKKKILSNMNNYNQFQKTRDQSNTLKDRDILFITLLNKIQFYDLTALLEKYKKVEQKNVKNNQHLLKEIKTVNIKSNPSTFNTLQDNLDLYYFSQMKMTFQSQTFLKLTSIKHCDLIGLYYSGNVQFFNPIGQQLAKWNLTFQKPIHWKITHPTFQKVLKRLQKTQKILHRIQNVGNSQQFKILFLLNRYFDRKQYDDFIANLKKKARSTRFTIESSEIKEKMKKNQQQQINFQSLDRNSKQIDAYFNDRLRQNYFQQQFQKKVQKQIKKRQKKTNAIENKINRVASLSAIKNFKNNEDIFKNKQIKIKASKSLYRIKASLVSAMGNYEQGNKDYQSLLKKHYKIKTIFPFKKLKIN